MEYLVLFDKSDMLLGLFPIQKISLDLSIKFHETIVMVNMIFPHLCSS